MKIKLPKIFLKKRFIMVVFLIVGIVIIALSFYQSTRSIKVMTFEGLNRTGSQAELIGSAIVSNKFYYIAAIDKKQILISFNLDSLKTDWEKQLPIEQEDYMHIHYYIYSVNDYLLITSGNLGSTTDVYYINPENGEISWQTNLKNGATYGQIFITNKTASFKNGNNEIFGIDLQTGNLTAGINFSNKHYLDIDNPKYLHNNVEYYTVNRAWYDDPSKNGIHGIEINSKKEVFFYSLSKNPFNESRIYIPGIYNNNLYFVKSKSPSTNSYTLHKIPLE